MNDIGIIIVTYNSAAEIGECLDAALTSGAEIVVVDNASQDRTIAEVARRGVRLIANTGNRGFAAAVNQGFAVLKCAAPEPRRSDPDVARPPPARLRPPRFGGCGRTPGGCRRAIAGGIHGPLIADCNVADIGSPVAKQTLQEQPGKPALPLFGFGSLRTQRG